MVKTLRVGLAGCGFAGHIHSRALVLAAASKHSSKVKPELVAVADNDLVRAQQAASQYGWQHATDNWQDLFEHDLDLVIVALPNNAHIDITKLATERGCAVLLEKPITRTLNEAKQLASMVESNKRIRVAYVNRFVPAVQAAYDFIKSGQLGSVRTLRSVYMLNMRKPAGHEDWRFSESIAGHGASDDLASHHIDMIQFLTSPVKETVAMSRVWSDISSPISDLNDDVVNGIIALENDAVGTIIASRTSPGHPLTGWVEIEGSKAAIRVDRTYLNDLFIMNEQGEYIKRPVRPSETFATMWAAPTVQGAHPFSWYDCFAFQMTEMLLFTAGLSDAPWLATIDDGVSSMEVTEAMIKSTETKKIETVLRNDRHD